MRTDLRRACLHCALRLPEACAQCPRCRLATTSPRAAVAALGNARKAVQVSRPLRDALLYVPAALLFVVAVGAALYVAGLVFAELGESGGGLPIAVGVIALFAVFACSAAALAIPWGVWALVVVTCSWVFGGRKETRLRVAAVTAAPPTPTSSERPFWRALDRLRRIKGRLSLLAIALVLGLELAFELRSKDPFAGLPGSSALSIMGGVVLGQIVSLVILAMPLSIAWQALVALTKKLRFLAGVLRERRRDEAFTDPTRAAALLREGRPLVQGVARAGASTCVAPLSGRKCLGFRLVGRVGRALIDDGELGEVLVRTGDEDVVVRARSAVVSLPAPEDTVSALPPGARDRVARFLGARDLELADDLELGETLLLDETAVTVHGTEDSEPFSSEGYRTASRRRVLGDGDGRPVLVEV